MRNAHHVETIRAAEHALMAQLPAGTLMQRAATGLAAVCATLLRRVYGRKVVVLAGSGDNGGDALYAGARLARRGAQVVAVAAGSRIHQQGADALRAAGGRIAGAEDNGLPALIDAADLVVDGLLGIGGRGGLRDAQARLAGLTAKAARPVVVAVDLPSGINADTGEVTGPAIRADVTVTFGTWKPGLLIDPGAAYAGVAELIDIGLGPHLPPPDVAALGVDDVASLLPRPGRDSDKYRRGVVGIMAGSDRFTGAAALAVGGAIYGGAGMVRLVSATPAVAVVRQQWPEAVITMTGDGLPPGEEVGVAGRVQAWVAGPGMGTDEAAGRRLAAVLATDVPVLVDADGLTLIAADHGLTAGRVAPTVLTPHAGELARLLGADAEQVAARRAEYARAAAAEFGATVLLKGSTTVIAPAPAASGHEPVLVNTTGTAWLATAGSGDVLSGLGGALLAQRLSPGEAAATAAFLHGLAARRAAGKHPGDGARGGGPVQSGSDSQAPIGASDVIRALPDTIRVVLDAAR